MAGHLACFAMVHLLLFFSVHVSSYTEVEYEFKKAKIWPKVIDKAPKDLLFVTYGNKSVELGNELGLLDVALSPSVDFPDFHSPECFVEPKWKTIFQPRPHFPVIYPEENYLHTLIMIAYQASNGVVPLLKDMLFLQWLVVNIPGKNTQAGDTVTLYTPITALPLTGEHRYVFLIYRQPCKFPNTPVLVRNFFDVKRFVKEKKLRRPLAGNYFKVQVL